MATWIRVLISATLALSMLSAGCGKEDSKNPAKPVEHSHEQIVQVTTRQEFETRVLQADKPILVDFYATWCQPCKILAPIIEGLSSEYKDRAEFVKVDGDRSPELLRAYNIPGYPTVLIFSRGKPGRPIIGVADAKEYRAALDAAIATTNQQKGA